MLGGDPQAGGAPDWRAFARLGRGDYPSLLAGTLATLLRSALLIAATLAIARLMTPDGARQSWMLAAVAAACTIASGIAAYAARAVTVGAVKRVNARLRIALVEATLALPSGAVERIGAARLRHILAQDSERLDCMANALLGVILPAVVTAVAILAALIWIAPLVGLSAALLCGLLVLLRRGSARKMRRLVDEAQEAIERLDSGMALLLHRHGLARSSASEDFERAERSRQIEETARWTGTIARRMARLSEVEGARTALAILALILLLAHAPADLLAIDRLAPLLFLLVLLRGAVQQAQSAARDVDGGRPALVRVQQLLEHGAPTASASGVAPRDWIVEARGIAFGHGDDALLRGVDLALAAGEVTVVSGANGTGKTTFLAILLGLITPRSGAVSVDGVDLREIDGTTYRRGIGHVAQSAVLFPGTIADNIAYGDPAMARAIVRRAAEATGVAGFADALPGGLDFRLGDGGAPLSGGQRQRIALARALARRPRLLILDEPGNHLDADAVQGLVAALRALADAPAVLIVSHDPVIIAAADHHYRLADGILLAPDRPATISSAA